MSDPSENPFRDTGPAAGMTTVTPQAGGVVQVEQQRAVAEIQARMLIARANPRDAVKCMDLVLQDCERPTVAEHAVYQYARGGTDISGPSIKLAESIARRWGNVASGFKELARSGGFSEVVAYAWDLETGYYDERVFQVRHWRDTKGGGYPLRDERDIYELVANSAQRRKRAALLSVLPPDVVDAAVHKCEQTLKARADTSEEGMARMVEAFKEFGVTKAQIEARIQRRLGAISAAQVVGLKRIYASLRDGMATAAEFFEPDAAPDAAADSGGDGTQGKPVSATERMKETLKGRARRKGASAVASTSDTTAPPASSEAGATGDPGPDAVTLRGQLMAAADKDAAMLVIDRARSLPREDYDSLVSLLDQRFPPE